MAICWRPAAAQTDLTALTKQWGVLAELVGRNLQYHQTLISARWIETGKQLELIYYSKGHVNSQIYTLDPATGEIIFGKLRLTALTDGTVVTIEKNSHRVLARGPDGSILWWDNMQQFKPTIAGSWPDHRYAELVAQGQLPREGAGLAVAADPQSSVQTVASARPVSAAVPVAPVAFATPAAPPNADQRSGLGGYVGGGAYALVENGQQVEVVRLRWLTPGRRWEIAGQSKFGKDAGKRIWELADDGVITGEGDGGSARGILGATGLPIIEATNGAERWEVRIEPAAQGFVRRVSRNAAKPGKPPKWKLVAIQQLSRIEPAAADRLAADWDAQRKKRWAPLALLTERPWFCVQTEPVMWSSRNLTMHRYGRPNNRSYPTTRLTTARWINPWASIEIKSTLGDGRTFTDTISERGDGTLTLVSVGHDYLNQAVGHFDKISISQTLGKNGNEYHNGAGAYFPLKVWNYDHSTFDFGLSYGAETRDNSDGLPTAPFSSLRLFGYDRDPFCAMLPYDAAAADRYHSLLNAAREISAYEMDYDEEYWSAIGADEGERQSMRANMDRQLFGALMDIPRAVAEVRQQNAELANLRRAAEEETRQKQAATEVARRGAAAGGTARAPSTAALVSTAALPKTTSPKTPAPAANTALAALPGVAGSRGGIGLQFYFVVGILPGPNATRNPRCFSEIISLSQTIDPHAPDHFDKVEAAAGSYRERFMVECRRHGQITGSPMLLSNVEQGSNFDSLMRPRNAEDIYVRVN